MVEGRLRKFVEEVVLMEQKFVVNDSINVKVCAVLILLGFNICIQNHKLFKRFLERHEALEG